MKGFTRNEFDEISNESMDEGLIDPEQQTEEEQIDKMLANHPKIKRCGGIPLNLIIFAFILRSYPLF